MSRRSQLRRAAATLGILSLGASVLTGCASSSDQSKVYWKEVETQKIVALDSTQSTFLSGGRYSFDGESRIDYRFARETRDGAIREDLVSNLMERIPGYYTNVSDYVVDVYEDAEPKGAKLSVYECQDKEAKDRFPFSLEYNTCATEDGQEIDFLVRLHVPKGTVDRSFGSETRGDGGEGSGDGSSSR